MMQKMAIFERGVGAKLSAARSRYRDYMQFVQREHGAKLIRDLHSLRCSMLPIPLTQSNR